MRRPTAHRPEHRAYRAHPRPLVLAAALLLAPGAAAARAQGNAAVVAAATVTEAIAVTALTGTPMDFGTVHPGVDATMSWTAPAAGGFEARYKKNESVDLVFTFTPLGNGTGGSLVIEGIDGCWAAGNAAKPAACPPGQSFVPTAARTSVPITANNGRFRFWIGARVRPAPGQPPGSYAGTIQVTALTPST